MRKSAKSFTTSNRAAQRIYEHYYGWPRKMVSKYFHLHHTHGTIDDKLYINDPNSMILLPIAAHSNYEKVEQYQFKKGHTIGPRFPKGIYQGHGFKNGYDPRRTNGFKKGNQFGKLNKGRIPVHKKRAKLIRLLNDLDIKRVGKALRKELEPN